eukprot:gene45896-58767_t
MLNINGITVRLGGRAILDGASAALPPKSRLEPDLGEIEMPRGTRIGYIAQEAPSGTTTPVEAVLAADTERASLLEEAETCQDPDRMGGIYERLT